ncbi:MAG: GAF domain-containing protein [Thermodesulfobacteriota bacterium]
MDDTKGIDQEKEKRGEEILNVVRKGAEFTHDILKENEKLRFKIAQVEEENESFKRSSGEEGSKAELELLRTKLNALEKEKLSMSEKFKAVEEENLDFANKYVEIEHENNMLANLYISSYQLHSTLELNEVLRIIMEIIINLVGAEQFALLMLDEKTHELKAVAAEGIERENIPPVKTGEGPIGTAVKTAEDYYRAEINKGGAVDTLDPMVCIPMKINERVIGAIVIYKLLQQKDSFSTLDYELFSMLAGHTATAIFSSKLYSESERKLSTIQGFIDLLTK